MTWRVAILAFTIMLAGATAPVIRDAVGGRDGYRVMGVVMATVILIGVLGAWWGTRHAPIGAVERGRRARCASSCGSSPGPATSGCCSRPSSCRRSRPGACSPASTTSPRTCWVARRPPPILFVCFVGPALLLTPLWARWGERVGKKQGYVASSLLLAAGAALAVLAQGRQRRLDVRRDGPRRRRLRRLPGLPDGDAARRRRGGRRPDRREPGRRLHRRLDRRRDARPRPGPGALRPRARARRLPSRARAATSPSPTPRSPRSRYGFSMLPGGPDAAQPLVAAPVPLGCRRRGGGGGRSSPCDRRDPERSRALQGGDLPVHGGRTLAYVYDSGASRRRPVGREAVAAYAGSNGLDPTSFPSLLPMENDLVGFACDLLDAPASAVGTVTSGGTESVLLAVQGARDSRPGRRTPAMVLPADRARGLPQGRPLLRRRGRPRAGRTRLPRRRRRDGRRHRRRRRCWSWPARRRTRTASSTR